MGPDCSDLSVDRKAQWQKADGEREEEEDPKRETQSTGHRQLEPRAAQVVEGCQANR